MLMCSFTICVWPVAVPDDTEWGGGGLEKISTEAQTVTFYNK